MLTVSRTLAIEPNDVSAPSRPQPDSGCVHDAATSTRAPRRSPRARPLPNHRPGKLAWQIATSLVEAGGGERPGALNQAMMELGATLCAPSGRGTDPRDPLRDLYWSVRVGREAFAASKAGDLKAMLGIDGGDGDGDGEAADQRAALGIHSCPVRLPTRQTAQPRPWRSRSRSWRPRPPITRPAAQVCKNGAAPVLEALRSIAEGGAESEDAAAELVHSLLPLTAAKKTRREERLALAALYADADAGRRWLLVRRPVGSGLLSGQWEFPHAVVAVETQSGEVGATGPRPDSTPRPLVPTDRLHPRAARIPIARASCPPVAESFPPPLAIPGALGSRRGGEAA